MPIEGILVHDCEGEFRHHTPVASNNLPALAHRLPSIVHDGAYLRSF